MREAQRADSVENQAAIDHEKVSAGNWGSVIEQGRKQLRGSGFLGWVLRGTSFAGPNGSKKEVRESLGGKVEGDGNRES